MSHLGSAAEDVYRMTQQKWKDYQFEAIEAFLLDEQVVAISGVRRYGSYLRILMNHYLLKSLRKHSSGLAWRAGGFVERHLAYAKEKGYEGVFFSIYAHNSRLSRYVDYMKVKKTNRTKPFLHHFNALPNKVIFNGVEQTIFYKMLNPEKKFDVQIIANEVGQ